MGAAALSGAVRTIPMNGLKSFSRLVRAPPYKFSLTIFVLFPDATKNTMYPNGDILKTVSPNGCIEDQESKCSKCLKPKLGERTEFASSLASIIKDETLKATLAKVELEKRDKACGKASLQNGVSVANDSDENGNGILVEKGELEANEKCGEKKDDQDVVFVQDVGFTVKIQSPGTETFEIQVGHNFCTGNSRYQCGLIPAGMRGNFGVVDFTISALR